MYNLEDIKTKLEMIITTENIKYNEPMKKHTSMKVGGNADIFIEIDNVDKLKEILQIEQIYKKIIPITIIGNGTNIIVKDEGIRGIVIKYIAKQYQIIDETDKNNILIQVDTGLQNAAFAQVLLQNEITGFEFAAGIPGTIGGAIVMNAGAFGGEIANIVQDITYIDIETNEIKTIKNIEAEFDYRTSIFQNKLSNAFIISVIFKLTRGIKENIKNTMQEYMQKRISTQPLEFASSGSTFKRGKDFITAKLIDDSGLKGYTIGGAQISEKHAGFIINKGNATASDVIELINFTKETVYKKFNKNIETEVRILG